MSPTYTLDSPVDVSLRSVARDRQKDTEFFELDPLKDPRWKAFTDWHPDASVFHRVEWLQALKTCYGYDPIVFSLTPPGCPLETGLLICRVNSRLTGRRFVSVPFSDHCEPLVSHPEEVDVLLAGLANKTDKSRGKYFEIRPIVQLPNDQTNLGISQNYYLHRLDLRRTEEKLFKSFHKDSIQRKIRRAEREGLRYEGGSTDELLNCFYKLLIMTRRRHGLPPQPLKWFRAIIAALGQDAKIRVAFKEDIPVASIFTVAYKKTLIYKYGSSDSQFNNLGGTPFLFWKAIQEAKANGIEE